MIGNCRVGRVNEDIKGVGAWGGRVQVMQEVQRVGGKAQRVDGHMYGYALK